jgi:hypothetical protein
MATKKAQQVICPVERFIPSATSVEELLDAFSFSGSLPSQDLDKLKQFAQLLAGTSRCELEAISRRVKTNFTTFSSAAAGKALPLRKGKPAPTDEQLDALELQFVEDFCSMMDAAHYRLLTQDEWDTALAEEFTFNMPVEVNWDVLDKSLLSRYWASHTQQRARLADVSDRILIFHRGVNTVHAKDMYIMDKIDLLIGYLVVNPIAKLLKRLGASGAEATAEKYSPMTSGNTTDQQVDLTGAAPSGMAAGSAGTYKQRRASLAHANAQVVERITLQRLMPDAAHVFQHLGATLQLQEPSFQDLVILYRRKVDTMPPGDGKNPDIDIDQRLRRRNINIKAFKDIPMADTEMIFPEKRVYIKPFVLINIFITIAVAVVTVMATFLQEKISLSVMGTLASAVAGRAYQVYYSATLSKQLTQDKMVQSLYDKTMDAQEGVVHATLDDMAQQHVKQVLLAYVLLLLQGDAMSRAELDQRCEVWLENTFGLKLDFAIEDSLPVLMEDGLIQDASGSGQGLLQAVSLDEAVTILKRKWETAYEKPQGRSAHESSFNLGRGTKAMRDTMMPQSTQGSYTASSTLDADLPKRVMRVSDKPILGTGTDGSVTHEKTSLSQDNIGTESSNEAGFGSPEWTPSHDNKAKKHGISKLFSAFK